jgi:bifunctional non-homologous end joining protein LigD
VFKNTPKTNEHPHWVRPELVAQIKFTEWTNDAKLRHPVYLGLRDDKKPGDVRREKKLARHSTSEARAVSEPNAMADVPRTKSAARRPAGAENRATDAERRTPNSERRTTRALDTTGVVDQLEALEKARRDGVLDLPDGEQLKVTNLHKVFWPALKLTKGDLFRYYARVAKFALPAVADRPLGMKRFPNGIAAAPFYQHRAPEVPAGVRSALVSVVEKRPQIIGGSLKTLLYMTQLAAISQDPWFSRVVHPEFADYAAFDLDPSDGVPFARVLDVARWIRDELDTLGAVGVRRRPDRRPSYLRAARRGRR